MADRVRAAVPRRARTADQKEDRREAILAAAIAYMRDSGFDGVTMAGLAKRAGLAKGTLYLYFRTREELFLALYVDAARAWCERLVASLSPAMNDEALVEALVAASSADPLFIVLASRLSSVIERNVPDNTLIGAKRTIFAIYSGLLDPLEQGAGLAPGEGWRFGSALMSLLLGAAQMDSEGLAGREDLPEDVQTIIRMSAFETVFKDGVRALLAGTPRARRRQR